MRTFIIRGAMITFFAVTGLFGSAATVQFDGMSANIQTYSAEARYMHGESCQTIQDEPNDPNPSPTGWKCIRP